MSVLSAVLALAVAAGPSAGTGPDGARAAAAEGSCPDPEAVRSALRKLATEDDPDRLLTATADAGLAIEDLGDRMRVRVGGRTRTYADATRDCERRARIAAVFAALVLTPGDAEESGEDDGPPVPPPPPAPSAPPIVAAAPAAEPRPPAEISLDAGSAVAIAPHGGTALISPAVIVGATRAGARWRLALGAGIPVLPATFSIGATTVGVTRYPLRLSGGRVFHLGRARAAVEAGAVVSVLRVERTGPPPATAATRVEPGAHVGAELCLPVGRVSVFLAVASDWIPRTYPITLDPEGEVDRTPALWLSGEAGLRFSLH